MNGPFRTRRPLAMASAVVSMLIAIAAAPLPGSVPPERPFDLERRLETLDPASPVMYLELAEELADLLPSGESSDRALARRLYGLAGRLDPDGLAASAALGLASLAPDERIASRYRAAAAMLDPEIKGPGGGGRPEVDLETAFEVSDAFGEFRSGRRRGLQRLLEDPTRERMLLAWDDVLPGGVVWLRRQIEGGSRNRPPLRAEDTLAMIRVELILLDHGKSNWSTLLAIEDDPAIVDLRPERVLDLLLDDDAASRSIRRGGEWQAP